MLSALDLTTFLSGEACRINSHSMDFSTSPTIHPFTACVLSSLVRHSLSHFCIQAFKPFLPLKWHLYRFGRKAFRSSLLSHRFLLCTDLIAACRWEIRSDICGYPSLWMPESLFLPAQLSSLTAEKVCAEVAITCAKVYDNAKNTLLPKGSLKSAHQRRSLTVNVG